MKRVLLALLATAPAAAQENPVVSVSCNVAVERALARAPSLSPLQRRHAEARADALEAWPALEIRGRTGAPLPLEATRVGLRAALPIPGQRAAEAEGWRARGAEAEAEANEAALELAFSSREAHLAVRRARAALAWLEEDQRFATTRLDGLRIQLRAGFESTLNIAREALALDALGDELAQARAALADADADLAALTAGGVADDGACAPAGAAGPEHPAIEWARAGVRRAAGEGEARRREGWLWPTFVEVDWDQLQVTSGRVLLSFGVALPSFADESAEADAGDQAARASLAAAETRTQGEVARLEAKLRAADALITELDARALPKDLEQIHEIRRLRPNAPDTIAVEALIAKRNRRRAEARFERESLVIALNFARGRP